MKKISSPELSGKQKTQITDTYTDITGQKLAEVRYKAIINSAIDGFWITDCEGNFRDVNDAYCSLTGYTREELLQMTISDLEAAETSSETARHMQNLMNIGYDRFETRHRCRDGRIVDIEVSVNFTDIEGGILFAHLRDISRRKRWEREIKRNGERLESLLKVSQHKPASVQDLLDFTLNEAITLTESKLGYIYFYDDKTKEFQLNTWSRDVMAECKIAEKNTIYQLEKTGIWGEAVRQGKPVMVNDFQALHPLKKGYPEGHAILYKYLTIPVFSDDHVVAVVGVANKMTDYDESDVRQLMLLMNSAWKIVERTRAEDALKTSEIRYRRLFETAQDGILIIDMDTERITDVNPFLMDILGYSKGEFLGKHLWEIGVFKDTALSKASFEELKSKGYIRYEDLPLETKDGQSISLEFISNVYEVDHTKVIQCNIRDITKRKRAECELRDRTAQLEAANRELESFSYSVSHDLRAPLRAIDGYSRMILKKQGDQFDDDIRGKFDVIRSSTQVMGQLIDDLLAFSRMGKQEMTLSKLDMGDLFKDAGAELKLANADRKMTLTIGKMPPVRGDRGLMKQVIINLLSNAIKFTKHLDDAKIEAGAFGRDNEIVFYVKDNGAGFDMQYKDKLFGVFQRLHRAEEFEGTGVGLAIVQRIIHRHGGRVWAESEIDRGACFYFTLQKL
jgi:two-component system, sensor histidine kinase and response regulator